MRILFKLLLLLCYAGMAASAAIHVVAVLGRSISTILVFTLHLGVIVTVLATTLAERRRVNGRDSKQFLRIVWAATPMRLRHLARGAFAYFVVLFLWFNVIHGAEVPGPSGFPSETLVVFSAGWLTAYAALAASLRFLLIAGAEPISTAGARRL